MMKPVSSILDFSHLYIFSFALRVPSLRSLWWFGFVVRVHRREISSKETLTRWETGVASVCRVHFGLHVCINQDPESVEMQASFCAVQHCPWKPAQEEEARQRHCSIEEKGLKNANAAQSLRSLSISVRRFLDHWTHSVPLSLAQKHIFRPGSTE